MAELLKEARKSPDREEEDVRAVVSEMLLRIDREGIDAIRHYSRELDDWAPESFVIDADSLAAASRDVDPELVAHLAFGCDQVTGFAKAQLATLSDLEVETLPGVRLGHRHIPVAASGAYVPGGRYPMMASAFMTVAVPKVAGVKTVVAATPPRSGRPPEAAMLHAIASSGADAVLSLGGVQALAALAIGVEGLPPVDVIAGAGNSFVAEAKRQLFGRVGIDLLAGPTEIAVIADAAADPELVAADLLGQAEHGPTSAAALITTSRDFGLAAIEQVDRLLSSWPTRDIAAVAWRDRGTVTLVADQAEAIAVADEIAPEHLELQVAEADLDHYMADLRNYGSLFVGAAATVAYGDKAIGTNHVLPTMGAARYTGGLWVGKYLKTCTYQRLTDEGTRRVAPAVTAICEAEGFRGHALTATMRLDRLASEPS